MTIYSSSAGSSVSGAASGLSVTGAVGLGVGLAACVCICGGCWWCLRGAASTGLKGATEDPKANKGLGGRGEAADQGNNNDAAAKNLEGGQLGQVSADMSTSYDENQLVLGELSGVREIYRIYRNQLNWLN